MVMRRSVALVATGGVIGLVTAILLARSLAGVLYGVGPFDLPTFAGAAAVLLTAGAVAGLVPAVRTARVDPMVALREW
jgi:putative ABC transport system permease protein